MKKIGFEINIMSFMKRIWFVIAFLCVLSACGKNDDSQTIDQPETLGPDLNKSDITKRIMAGSDVIANFIRDTTIELHDGLSYTKINYTNQLGLPMQIFIMEADLKKPELNLQAMSPYNDYLYGFQQISEMCRDNQIEGESIYAGINCDFFNTSTGQCQSIFYVNGFPIQATPVVNDRTALVVYKDKSLHMWSTATDRKIDPSQVQQAVGGGSQWLISYGQKVKHTDVTIEPRTAIGFTKDQVVYSIVADGRQVELSNGMSFIQERDILYALNCYDAINLDGGGSSTMVLRDSSAPRGFKVQNSPSDGVERAVGNGLAFVVKEEK
ncbi:Predicted protein [bacterium A37T11]|nr:Predicted protein [bacterium A37T11]